MSFEAINWAYKIQVGGSAQKAVLLVLANYADEDDSAYPGIKRIATMTQLSERTVQRAVSELESEGTIRVAPGAGTRGTNRYFLDLSWRGGDTMTPPRGDTVTPGGDTVASNTKKNLKRATGNNMPAARVNPTRAARGKTPADTDEVLGRDERADVETTPAPSKRRGSSIGGLAKDFERSARWTYPLGDSRRVTNLTALRANISRWHKQDGIPLAEIDQAMGSFWAGNFVKHDGEPWRRFINVFARVHAMATAPDTSDPAHYTDYDKDTGMSELEKWMKEQGL